MRGARDVGVEPWDQCRAGLGGGRRRGLNGHKTRTVGGEHDVFEPHLKRPGKAPAGIRAHFDIAILNVAERPFANTSGVGDLLLGRELLALLPVCFYLGAVDNKSFHPPEWRRVWEECVSACRYRWLRLH